MVEHEETDADTFSYADGNDHSVLFNLIQMAPEALCLCAVQKGADVNTKDEDKYPYEHALDKGYNRLVKAMVDKGCELRKADAERVQKALWAALLAEAPGRFVE